MSRTNSGLATQPRASGAITKPQRQSSSRLQGEEDDDIILPRLHLFQGLPSERQIYGDHREGDLINTLSGEKIASRDALPKFVPIFAWNLWIKFKEPRGAGIDYMTREKKDVPAADLEWVETPKGRKPGVTKIMNWVCLFEGHSEPMVLSFKSTSIKAGQTLNTLEKMRGDSGKGFGLYALELQPRSNSQGAWLSPKIRPAGDPPAEMGEIALGLFNSLSGNLSVTTNVEDVSDEDDFDPDRK